MMGAVAVTVVVLCVIVYTATRIVEHRMQREFREHLRQYIREQTKKQRDYTDADV